MTWGYATLSTMMLKFSESEYEMDLCLIEYHDVPWFGLYISMSIMIFKLSYGSMTWGYATLSTIMLKFSESEYEMDLCLIEYHDVPWFGLYNFLEYHDLQTFIGEYELRLCHLEYHDVEIFRIWIWNGLMSHWVPWCTMIQTIYFLEYHDLQTFIREYDLRLCHLEYHDVEIFRIWVWNGLMSHWVSWCTMIRTIYFHEYHDLQTFIWEYDLRLCHLEYHNVEIFRIWVWNGLMSHRVPWCTMIRTI